MIDSTTAMNEEPPEDGMTSGLKLIAIVAGGGALLYYLLETLARWLY